MRTSRPDRPASRRRRGRDDGGVSSIELAIIAPTLLALIFLVIQGALYFYGRSVALQSAREGVSQLRLQQTGDLCKAAQGQVQTDTTNYAATVGSNALKDVGAAAHCNYIEGGNSTVSVTVSGHAISLLGFSLSVNESATGRVEQFQDNG